MTPRTTALAFRWRVAPAFAAALLVVVVPDVFAAPRAKKSSGQSATGGSSSVQPAGATKPAALASPGSETSESLSSRGEWADAHPSSRPSAPDQQLSREGERKSGALAVYAQGLLLEDAAENDGALSCFRRAFDLDTRNSDLAVKLAYMLAQRNDATGGIEVLKDAIKASPKEPLPLIYLSQLYAKYLKKPEAGIRYAEQALALGGELYPSYLALFELFSATNQQGRVDQLLQRAAKSTSRDSQFWLQIGNLFQQAYLKPDGNVVPPERLKQMNEVYTRAAQLGSSDALVLAKVGNYFIESNQAEAAIGYYGKAFSLKQSSDDPILANAGDKLARALSDAGQQEKAISVLEKVTAENPLRFETFELLGELYQRKGDLDRALANYKQSTLLDGSEPRNYIRVAELQIQLEQFNDAIETAASARARFPGSPEALYLQAFALTQAKRSTDALAVYAEALAEFETNHEEFLTPQFYFQYGAAAEQAGVFDKAIEMLKRSITLDPGTSTAAQAANYLGYMWVERGENLEEAGEMIQKAVTMEPDNGAFLDSLGWYFYKKGDYEKALAQLLKAAELIKPEDAVVLEHVGDVYQQMSKTAQALQYWQKAALLDGASKKIADKIESAKQKVSANTPAPGKTDLQATVPAP